MRKITFIGLLCLGFMNCKSDIDREAKGVLSWSVGVVVDIGYGLDITSNIQKKRLPQTVVGDFVLDLANGNCEEAIKSTIGKARETVQASWDAGCEEYKTIIKGVNCELNEEDKKRMICDCIEEREGLEMTYFYELKKIKRTWKIENYSKEIDSSVD